MILPPLAGLLYTAARLPYTSLVLSCSTGQVGPRPFWLLSQDPVCRMGQVVVGRHVTLHMSWVPDNEFSDLVILGAGV